MYSTNENNHSSSLHSPQVTQMMCGGGKNCKNTEHSGWFEISEGYHCLASYTDIVQVKQISFALLILRLSTAYSQVGQTRTLIILSD